MQRRQFLRNGLFLGAASAVPVSVAAACLPSDVLDIKDTVLSESIDPMIRAFVESTASYKAVVLSPEREIAVAFFWDEKTMPCPILAAKGDDSLERSIWKVAIQRSFLPLVPLIMTKISRWLSISTNF